jgi:glycosyltransferase involved in cell wall biosynthesis
MSAIAGAPDCSLVIPVYRNEGSIPDLLDALDDLARRLGAPLEVVFVVDGSPDRCAELLDAALPSRGFASQLILLARNFGSFAAIREGLLHARGQYFAVMAADLQEPPELALEFFRVLREEPVDVVLGTRSGRADALADRIASRIFWGAYRRFVQPDIPPGGIDMFGCNRVFRDHLLALGESNSSLVGQVVWLGHRRKLIPYVRRARQHGRSAWTFSRKVTYLMNSVFSFSDLPVKVLVAVGTLGLLASAVFALAVLVARLSGLVDVPGYAATVLTILFFAALNSFGLGIIGAYVWRAYENTKQRPHALVLTQRTFEGRAP